MYDSRTPIVGVVSAGGAGATAGAAGGTSAGGTAVSGVTEQAAVMGPVATSGGPSQLASSGLIDTLPFTGLSLLFWVLTGITLIAVGMTLVRLAHNVVKPAPAHLRP